MDCRKPRAAYASAEQNLALAKHAETWEWNEAISKTKRLTLKATQPATKSLWLARYSRQVDAYIGKHFGKAGGVTELFPYMKDNFTWWGKTDPSDPRTALKTNNEYHGLEQHAKQYYATAQYREAAEHWLVVAAWRREMMQAQNLSDRQHLRAVEFAIRNYQYNMALDRWQRSRRPGWQVQRRTAKVVMFPAPESFGLKSSDMDSMEVEAATQMESITGHNPLEG
jgi:hypothetical protein